ncbi:hypothetical protein B0T11DRAFT_341029 [Plectosphaerella cucumerina]|uniref:SnoaL-like domain-containing protein n=1 Tax=Plectosphaerella cucumerina TaxID=40658 RepID=A0A8K0TEQ4_9PEZI|nr:hypothetical protein B0T11DRAFT_341029 [Plectosphaerella cucumerina]
MTHSYESEWPQGVTVDQDLVAFFRSFYEISDIEGVVDQYVDQFTPDATFIPATRTLKGHDQIRAIRAAQWQKVGKRTHSIDKIFPFGSNSNELMLYGTVAMESQEGSKGSLDWAARAIVSKDAPDGKYRLKFYQVYLDYGAISRL